MTDSYVVREVGCPARNHFDDRETLTMSEYNPSGPSNLEPGEIPTAILAEPPQQNFWGKLWLLLKVVQARLRFVVLLVAIGGVIVYWPTLRAYYEKWQRQLHPGATEQAGESDVEYFCPMHPQIIRDNPKEKCPICGMPLSKRNKGNPQPLPDGIASRVQLTPYRVVLADVHTTEVTYQPLHKEISTVGLVEFDEGKLYRISARLPGRSRIDKLYVNITGQTVNQSDALALLYNQDAVSTVQNLLDAKRNGQQDLVRDTRSRLYLWGIDNDQIDKILKDGKPITHVTIRAPSGGHVIKKYQVEGEYVEEGARLYDVADLSRVWIQAQVYEADLALLREGMPVSATTLAFPNREFAGRVAFIQPHLDQNSRTLTVRFDLDNPEHELRPGMYATVKLRVPASQLDLLPPGAGERQKKAFEQGQVLAVPESSVIDTGSRKIIYRQTAASVFDGVEVRLGPRMLGPKGMVFYPVLRGLEAGEQVVTAGSFLIDAETRLNPAAGSIYFGGSSGGSRAGQSTVAEVRPSTPEDQDEDIRMAFARLDPEDRRLAEAQGFCPILQDNRLGVMGKPFKLWIKGQPVFLCCKGCEKEARAHPDETLANVEKVRGKAKAVNSRP